MEEEEDVVFDRASLLTNRIKPIDEVHSTPPATCRALKTFFLCAAFFGLGLCTAIPGPTLLDLKSQTNTSVEQITQIFIGRAVGTLVGSMGGGFIVEKLNETCLLSFMLFLMAVGTAAAPWCRNFVLLTSVFTFQGISMGFLDTGCNYACLSLWGRRSGPYMQAMHFSFGMGAFVAPLIAEPFLGPTNITLIGNQASQTVLSSQVLNLQDESGIVVPPGNNSQAHQLFRRDIEPVSTSPALEPPKKPSFTGNNVNKDAEVANGSKLGKELRKMAAKGEDKNPTPLLPVAAQNESALTEGLNISLTTKPPTTTTSTTTTTTTTTTTPAPTTTTVSLPPAPLPINGSTNVSQSPPPVDGNSHGLLQNFTDKVKDITKQVTTTIQDLTKVQFAYLTIALYIFLLSCIFSFLCCCSRGPVSAATSSVEPEFTIRRENRGFRVQILLLLFFFNFIYMGMEQTYGGLIMTFSVSFRGWSKDAGAMLTAVFWGSFAATRGVSIILARVMTPAIMLICDLVVVSVALIALVLTLEIYDNALWVCTAVLGIGMASVFPTAITWAERYMYVTGKATAVILIGSSLGAMSIPAITGFLFEAKGPMWLMYILLGLAIINPFLYIIMQNLASNKGERYEKLIQREIIELNPTPSSTSNGATSSQATNGKKRVSFKLPSELKIRGKTNRGKND